MRSIKELHELLDKSLEASAEASAKHEEKMRLLDEKERIRDRRWNRRMKKMREELAAQRQKHEDELAVLKKETEIERKKTEKKTKELEELFTSQWGKLIESLVEGDLVNLLQQKGIDVTQTTTNLKYQKNGEHAEFDIIALNGTEMVVVEVKTTLHAKHVEHFRKKMETFKILFPIYKNFKIYAAMAFLRQESHSAQRAENIGFFVIKATGKSAAIINKSDFKPFFY